MPSFSSWSLLNRLTLGVVLLSTLGVVASDIAAQSLLRTYLTQEVDNELLSIAGGSIPRLERGGIESDNDGDVDGDARTAQVRPLRTIPTATSVTLIGPAGVVLGQIGGDLNATEITSYLSAITPEKTAKYGNRPFTIETDEHDFRVLSQTLPSGFGRVVVAHSFEDIDRILARLQGLFILIGLVMIFFIALASRKAKYRSRPLGKYAKYDVGSY
jgi:two-component system, OmpR family, sensor kinase